MECITPFGGTIVADLSSVSWKDVWLKNHAPIEKSRRVKVRNRENSSRLVITELDVLDSGYYQCIASNSAASVNTTTFSISLTPLNWSKNVAGSSVVSQFAFLHQENDSSAASLSVSFRSLRCFSFTLSSPRIRFVPTGQY
ncbi:unnamed protein product [Strongylus vulgaris]|uniref:Ig-like domain-containing protein n=1 Tax=Strongylus vulgaris TaxID=40348 RepID=A0A3P7JMP9_STRVU|nr:unnamed protein product [Strongylus vulgaris]